MVILICNKLSVLIACDKINSTLKQMSSKMKYDQIVLKNRENVLWPLIKYAKIFYLAYIPTLMKAQWWGDILVGERNLYWLDVSDILGAILYPLVLQKIFSFSTSLVGDWDCNIQCCLLGVQEGG